MDVFDLVRWFGEQRFVTYARFAAVNPSGITHNNNAFGELVAQNYGFQIRAFDAEAAARAWLDMPPANLEPIGFLVLLALVPVFQLVRDKGQL